MLSPLLRARIVKASLIVILLSGGFLAYKVTLRPNPARLEQAAETALREIFGPDVRHGRVTVDLLSGVRIEDLRVPAADGGSEPALAAERVDIRHDVLALAAGVLRLRTVTIRKPRVTTREAADGSIVLDFPFDLPKSEGRTAPPPELVIEQGTLRLVASATSGRFRPGYVLEASEFHATALPTEDGGLDVAGGLELQGLGMEVANREIRFTGSANAEKGTLVLSFQWPRVFLTKEALDALSPSLRERVEAQRLDVGPHRLLVRLDRDPAVEEGRLRVRPEITVTVRPGELPGPVGDTVDARTREQLAELLGKIELTVELSGKTVDIRSLTSQLAGGEAKATGKIEDDGKTVDLTIEVTGVRLEDPAIRRALGPLGEQVFEEFSISGRADAKIHLQRTAGGPFVWDAVVDLDDVTAAYLGRLDAVLKKPSGEPIRNGFPYAGEHLKGRLRLGPDSVVLEGLEGKHGLATILVRGNAERARNGAETGYVRWDGGLTRLRFTIEAKNLAVDQDLFDAVDGSEFAGFLDRYRLSGVVDRVLLDVVQEEPRDKVAVVELEVELGGDKFVYAPFPLPMTDVSGTIVLLRPPVGDDARGKEFHVRAKGKGAGSDVSVEADLLVSDRKGRVRVTGTDVPLEGDLEKAVLASEAGAGGLGESWRFLHPFGRVDVEADFPTYDDPAPESFRVTLRDAGVHLRPDGPGGGARLSGFRGAVHVVGPRVTVSDVAGTFEGAPVRVSGSLEGGPGGEWDLVVASERVPLTEGLLDVVRNTSPDGDLLPEGLTVEPGGHVDLLLRLLRTRAEPGAERALAATVTLRNADLVVRLADLRVALTGDVEVEGEQVHLRNVTAKGAGISVTVPDAVLGPDGLRGTLSARFEDLVVGKEVLDLLPESVRGPLGGLVTDRLLDAVDLRLESEPSGRLTAVGALGVVAKEGAPKGGAPRGRFTFAPLVLATDPATGERALSGTIRIEGASIDAGVPIDDLDGEVVLDRLSLGDVPGGSGTFRASTARVAGIRVEGLEGPVSWSASVLRAGPLAGSVHGGRLDATVTAHTKAPSGYEARVALSGASLAGVLGDLGADDSEATGTFSGTLDLQNRSGTRRDLTGAGHAEVRCGDLGDVPVVATIPALVASATGGREPKLSIALVDFTIEEERFRASRITLAGPLFRMNGFGTMTFDGELDVTLAPQLLKSFFLPGWQDVPVARSALRSLSEDALYLVRVEGTIDDARTRLVPLPFLTGGAWSQRPIYRPSPLETKPRRRVPSLFR